MTITASPDHHLEALSAAEAVDLFEDIRAGFPVEVPAAVARLVPGLTVRRAVLVSAGSSSGLVVGARVIMLLGAARQVTGHGTLVPGDVLVLDPGEVVAVEPSDDAFDVTVLLAMA